MILGADAAIAAARRHIDGRHCDDSQSLVVRSHSVQRCKWPLDKDQLMKKKKKKMHGCDVDASVDCGGWGGSDDGYGDDLDDVNGKRHAIELVQTLTMMVTTMQMIDVNLNWIGNWTSMDCFHCRTPKRMIIEQMIVMVDDGVDRVIHLKMVDHCCGALMLCVHCDDLVNYADQC